MLLCNYDSIHNVLAKKYKIDMRDLLKKSHIFTLFCLLLFSSHYFFSTVVTCISENVFNMHINFHINLIKLSIRAG